MAAALKNVGNKIWAPFEKLLKKMLAYGQNLAKAVLAKFGLGPGHDPIIDPDESTSGPETVPGTTTGIRFLTPLFIGQSPTHRAGRTDTVYRTIS